MKTNLLAAIDTASAHTMAVPAAPAGQSGSVPISVLLIIVLGFWAWQMHKHGKDTKKLHLLPGFVCLGLGLSLSGTQVGALVGGLFGSVGGILATFVGNA
ncbi:hypothetical protein [Streptomyces antarcticus]|uniref:hypothetical protein n=1 Tax=Streptomyces antarcticus TaxID=2996458 RepID=UPI00227181A6|nr:MULTISPECIES: hypothetical protein [unclassified Streptomyces]MCY0943554.1 hypothetical protein [Streptomyces sp. H34-AA3]MCZ4083537.1 hypothetical protein [Streptomyces sp. H34-S5]